MNAPMTTKPMTSRGNSMYARLGRRLAAASLLALSFTLPAAASVLSEAAARLQPGQWSVLNRAGDGRGFDYNFIVACQATGGCYDTILSYADKGLWNPQTREIEFVGQGHAAEMKHISYSEANNLWTREAKAYWCSDGCQWGLGHGYEHSANNPATGDVYARRMNSGDVYKWTRSTKTWSQLPAGPVMEVAIAIEYFPEMGGVVLMGQGTSGSGEVHIYRESTGKWSQLKSGLSMGPYHNEGSYNPVHKVIVFGGGNGSSNMYKLDASGTVTPIANAPTEVRILETVWTVDPASGKYLLFANSGSFYQYDVPSNSWNTLSTANVQMFGNGNQVQNRVVAIPIATYGVLAFLIEDGTADTRVVLYRHSAASQAAPPIDTTPPAVPSGLSVR